MKTSEMEKRQTKQTKTAPFSHHDIFFLHALKFINKYINIDMQTMWCNQVYLNNESL